MKCKNCGAENVDGLERCVACGYLLETKESKNRISAIGIVAALVLAGSIFLPFCSVNLFGSSLKIALSDGDWTRWAPVAVLALGGIVFSLTGNRGGLIVCGILGIAYFGYMFYRFETGLDGFGDASEYSEFMTALAKSVLQKDLGFYALAAGSVGLVIAGAIAPNKNS